MTVYEKSKSEVTKFSCPYRVKVECSKECNIKLNGERIEEVNGFRYLGSILCMGGEARERDIEGRKVVGSLEHIMKEKTVHLVVKTGLCDGIIVVTIPYGSETWKWKEYQGSMRQAVKMSYLRRGFGGRRIDGESNESA